MNTGWWDIYTHGCYSLVKIAFAPIYACKNNRRIWRHNASVPGCSLNTTSPLVSIVVRHRKVSCEKWQVMIWTSDDMNVCVAQHWVKQCCRNSYISVDHGTSPVEYGHSGRLTPLYDITIVASSYGRLYTSSVWPSNYYYLIQRTY